MKNLTIILCFVCAFVFSASAKDSFELDGAQMYLDHYHEQRVLSLIDEYMRSLLLFSNDEDTHAIINSFYYSEKIIEANRLKNSICIKTGRYEKTLEMCGELLSQIIPIMNESCVRITETEDTYVIEKRIMSYTEHPRVFLRYSQLDNLGGWTDVRDVNMESGEFAEKINSYTYSVKKSEYGIAFAFRVEMSGGRSYWDNNQGENYSIR